MPSRILKESIKTSDEIDALSWFEEVVFYRIIVTVDDYGRMDGRTVLVKNELFPTKDSVTKKSIEDALASLERQGLIRRYSSEGHPYICVTKWEKHQRVRSRVKRFPDPDDDLSASCGQLSASCGQLSASCGQLTASCQLESESKTESESESESKRARGAGDRFPDFWSAYPLHKAKQDAEKAWKRLNPSPELVERILTDIAARKDTKEWTKSNREFVPYPATYLNGKRWEDDLPGHGYDEHPAENLDHLLTDLDAAN